MIIFQGQLAAGGCFTAVRSYQLDLGSESELSIPVNELLIDDAYLAMVVNDMNS